MSPPSAKARLLDSRISNYASEGEQSSAKARRDDPRISICVAWSPPVGSADSQYTFDIAKSKGVGKRSCLDFTERERRDDGECSLKTE